MIGNDIGFELIPEWKDVALRSYSMWAIYLGLLSLVVPSLLFLFWSIESNPLLWGWLGLALLIGGGLGRVVRQRSISRG
jgi:lysozyme